VYFDPKGRRVWEDVHRKGHMPMPEEAISEDELIRDPKAAFHEKIPPCPADTVTAASAAGAGRSRSARLR
jgi:hypothetical protein